MQANVVLNMVSEKTVNFGQYHLDNKPISPISRDGHNGKKNITMLLRQDHNLDYYFLSYIEDYCY